VSGILLGRPGHEGVIPSEWVSQSVGGKLLSREFRFLGGGRLMYFATLTEVPILQGLIGSGWGKARPWHCCGRPALSLPSMLVLSSIMGTKKTVVYVSLVIMMATVTGLLYGALF